MTDENYPLRRAEAARYIGCAPHTLANMAVKGLGPVFHKRGGGKTAAALYLKNDLDAWLDAQTVRYTPQNNGVTL